MAWAKTTARRDEKRLCLGIGRVLYQIIDGTFVCSNVISRSQDVIGNWNASSPRSKAELSCLIDNIETEHQATQEGKAPTYMVLLLMSWRCTEPRHQWSWYRYSFQWIFRLGIREVSLARNWLLANDYPPSLNYRWHPSCYWFHNDWLIMLSKNRAIA